MKPGNRVLLWNLECTDRYNSYWKSYPEQNILNKKYDQISHITLRSISKRRAYGSKTYLYFVPTDKVEKPPSKKVDSDGIGLISDERIGQKNRSTRHSIE